MRQLLRARSSVRATAAQLRMQGKITKIIATLPMDDPDIFFYFTYNFFYKVFRGLSWLLSDLKLIESRKIPPLYMICGM